MPIQTIICQFRPLYANLDQIYANLDQVYADLDRLYADYMQIKMLSLHASPI